MTILTSDVLMSSAFSAPSSPTIAMDWDNMYAYIWHTEGLSRINLATMHEVKEYLWSDITADGGPIANLWGIWPSMYCGPDGAIYGAAYDDTTNGHPIIRIDTNYHIPPWQPNTHYPLNSFVLYQNLVYKTNTNHTSGPGFDPSFWMARPDLGPIIWHETARVGNYGPFGDYWLLTNITSISCNTPTGRRDFLVAMGLFGNIYIFTIPDLTPIVGSGGGGLFTRCAGAVRGLVGNNYGEAWVMDSGVPYGLYMYKVAITVAVDGTPTAALTFTDLLPEILDPLGGHNIGGNNLLYDSSDDTIIFSISTGTGYYVIKWKDGTTIWKAPANISGNSQVYNSSRISGGSIWTMFSNGVVDIRSSKTGIAVQDISLTWQSPPQQRIAGIAQIFDGIEDVMYAWTGTDRYTRFTLFKVWANIDGVVGYLKLGKIRTDIIPGTIGMEHLTCIADVIIPVPVPVTKSTDVGRHDHWLLLRAKDDNSVPPSSLWDNLRDSLSGFDDYMNLVPNPGIPAKRSIGIERGQSLFEGTRSSLLAARETFVSKVNEIFARIPLVRDREALISTLMRNTPIPTKNLSWLQLDRSYGFEPPPSNEWSIEVFSIRERNRLLSQQTVQDAVSNGTKIRVLLNGIAEPTKRWSIWEIDPARVTHQGIMYQDPDTVFQLAKSYDIEVESIEARDALLVSVSLSPMPGTQEFTLPINTKVLVLNDKNLFGFWSIYKWNGSLIGLDGLGTNTQGFQLWRTQYYRTADKISHVDWYAPWNAKPSSLTRIANTPIRPQQRPPPIINYATTAARDLAETTSPTNLFVKIDDDGDGSWIWTEWDTSAKVWVKVAIQNSTIALDDTFFNPNLVIWNGAVDSVTTGDVIKNRDGSWELRVIIDVMRYGGILEDVNTNFLLDSELNEIFFSMLNFALTQQNTIEWAFKTSFMTMLGYNVPLIQSPVVMHDNTPDLLSYITEIKPYHVKIRDFYTQYNAGTDLTRVHVTDFDKPVYFDPITKQSRVLQLDNPTDLEILSTKPWKDWYDDHRSNLPSNVRSFDIGMVFDRITGSPALWDSENWDSVVWDDGYFKQNIHLLINTTLSSNSPTVFVDDIRALIYATKLLAIVLPATINNHHYSIGTVAEDPVNVSKALHGVSGSVTLSDGVFSVSDGTKNNILEVIVPYPYAARRIKMYYNPTSDMPPKDLTLLLGLDARSSKVIQIVTKDALACQFYATIAGTTLNVTKIVAGQIAIGQTLIGTGIIAGTIITGGSGKLWTIDKTQSIFSTKLMTSGTTTINVVSTVDITMNQYVHAPSIASGTVVVDTTPTTITLSKPTIHTMLQGSTITITLTNSIDGDTLISGGFGDTTAFDVAGFDTIGFDTTVDRIRDELDAGVNPEPSVIHTSINPALPSQSGSGLREPYVAKNHPEECIPLTGDDGLHLIVHTLPRAGGPTQIIKTFDVTYLTTDTTTLFFDLMAQSSDAVLVYRDGLRADITDYTVDHLGRNVTVNLIIGSNRVRLVTLHIFGFGGTSAIVDRFYLRYANPTPITINTRHKVIAGTVSPITIVSNDLLVVVDGVYLNSNQFYYDGTAIAFASTVSADSKDMAIIAYDGVSTSATKIQSQTLIYNLTGTSQLRLAASGSAGNVSLQSPTQTSISLPVVSSTGQAGLEPMKRWTLDFATVAQSTIIEVNGKRLRPSNNIIVESSVPDYTIENSILIINTNLNDGDKIKVTSFSNDITMGWNTVSYQVGMHDHYFVPKPIHPDYAMVSFDGIALTPDDYEFIGLDSGSELILKQPYGSGWLVISVCTAPAARDDTQWMANTITPALIRMPPILRTNGTHLTGLPTHGTTSNLHALYDVRYDYLKFSLVGSLQSELAPDATQIVITEMSDKFEPLFIPTERDPGVVWIEKERIEYFGYTRANNTIVLSGLTRGTQGTSIGEQRRVLTAVTNNTHYPINGVGPVEVYVDNEPYTNFVASVSNNITDVILSDAIGDNIVIAMTTGSTYSTGTLVRNGKELIPEPLD